MENARKFLPLFIGVFVGFLVWMLSRKMPKSNENYEGQLDNLAKAREKLAVNRLREKDQKNEESKNNSDQELPA